ncbi:polysaccharide biosynthesis protein [Brevibacillus sp. SYSU BS000544]|uniref:polysaccharide biosynthesis protein n=1 Tax=Brevibacillus sp. SYSU BS000544 TaxID=3416443 RepID=UPI003CE57BEE
MSYKYRLFLFFVFDTIIIIAATAMSYFLRFDGNIPVEHIHSIPYTVGLVWFTTLILFYMTKLYLRVWQYASVGELISIVKAVTVSIGLDVFLYYFLKVFGVSVIIPRSIFPITWMTIILSIGGSRFIWRVWRDNYIKIKPHHGRAIIVGAGKAGALVARELKHTMDADIYPIAFIDDDPSKLKLEIAGLPVVGTRKDIEAVVEKYEIATIIIAIPSISREQTAKLIEICKRTSAHIKLLPLVSDVIQGKVTINSIRDVHVEDLLGRDPVEVDMEEITGYITGKTILVTGAGGSIGSELCRQIAPFKPKKLLLLGHGENSIFVIENELKRLVPSLHYETLIADIQDRKRIEEIFETYLPEVVFHAAAHKHVPLMEKNPKEAIKNNVFGTKNVAEMAARYNTKRFVLISTDKAVNPTSVMGATKRMAESIVLGLNRSSTTKFAAVRFGNVLGSRGSVIPHFKKQIELGGPVTVTHPEMVRYFMTIPEAVQLVIQAGAIASGGEVFVLDMGQPVKIDQLARDLIKLSGFEPDKDIHIVYSGIRPGEKLYEELLTDEEGTAATKHDRIFIGKPSNISVEELAFTLKRLDLLTKKAENSELTDELRVLLFGEVSSNVQHTKSHILEPIR